MGKLFAGGTAVAWNRAMLWPCHRTGCILDCLEVCMLSSDMSGPSQKVGAMIVMVIVLVGSDGWLCSLIYTPSICVAASLVVAILKP